MKLDKIYFDAFKSLLDTELSISENCIGFVGINESGKSNILEAVNCLNGTRSLQKKDTPKMDLDKSPQLRFKFTLDEEELSETLDELNSWLDENSLSEITVEDISKSVIYHVRLTPKNKEERFFTISGKSTTKDFYFLKKEFADSDLNLVVNGEVYSQKKALVISEDILKENQKLFEISKEIENLNKSIDEANTEEIELGSDVDLNSIENDDLKKLVQQKQKKVAKLDGFDLNKLKKTYQHDLDSAQKRLKDLESQLDSGNQNENQKKQLRSKIETEKEDIKTFERWLKQLSVPLGKRYINDFNLINDYLKSDITNLLQDKLPDVTFWEHKQNYVLESEYEFETIKKTENIDHLSRPLINIFRLGSSINSVEDLKRRIEHIQEDGNERSRLERQIQESVNEYIRGIWKEYDQDIHVTLEKERVRFEVTDPEYKDAHFYNMEERSQGCQTFISFLLTVGVEAQKGVINNSILLLDEPEAHLHPSGARFMLEELIKISKRNNNLVLYATHSEHMIDQNNYERHIIVEKEDEKTNLKLSKKNRIGYFIQEEVLYKALDIDISKEVASEYDYNFVFEGDGDVKIFKGYYTNVLRYEEPERPFKLNKTKFFQGGKCSDILKYFVSKPIQLGTKWIFILDNDKPANQLRDFLEGRYKNYIGKDIFIYQYPNELEDLLPDELVIKIYENTFDYLDSEFNADELRELVSSSKTFKSYHSEIVDWIDSGSRSQFRSYFKEKLNAEVEREVSGKNNEEEFEEDFPEYNNWVKKVIADLLEKKME